jgi:hypothetical protein
MHSWAQRWEFSQSASFSYDAAALDQYAGWVPSTAAAASYFVMAFL